MKQELTLGQVVAMKRDVAPHAGLLKGATATIGSIWNDSLIVVTRHGFNCRVKAEDVEVTLQPGESVTCQRCKHDWIPNVPNPVQCPSCKSAYWNKPVQRPRKGVSA